MALDSRYICSGDIESFFVDKLTALPLVAGVINFYVDGTNTPKSVYKLTGTPGTYSYVSLGDTITLNAAGEYQDSGGNPIVIYYFPYHCTVDGDPTTSTGVQELYSIAVFNSGAQQQYTRNAWPPLATNLTPSNDTTDVINYIPNGQFLFYNAPNQVSTTVTNSLHTNTALQIAQGGWTFQQTQGSTGSYTITFSQVPNGTSGIKDFPINAVNVVCNTAGNEAIHDLAISWPNVNTFSKQGGTNSFNLLFAASSVPLTTVNFGLYLTSYFGTGGSATTETLIGTISIAHGFNYYNTVINFPDNSASTIGAGNYIELSLRTPTGQTCNIQFTDFALVQGSTALSNFPVQSNAQMLDEGIAGWMPTPDPTGMDLYLPLILTPSGMTFDHSIVGTIIAKNEITALPNELPMNGTTYVASAYSSTGIPYQRLMNYLLLNSPSYTTAGGSILANGIPIYGTGYNFVTLFYVSTAVFNIQINTTANGGSATGSGAVGIVTGIANNYYTATVASVPTAGYYWSFTDGSASPKTYNVWYFVDNAGSPPTPPTGANIKVSIASTATLDQVALATIAVLNQYQFVLPNLAGLFLRGYDPNHIYDADYATRTMNYISFNNTPVTGNNDGSYEASAFLQHVHAPATGFTTFIGNETAGGTSSLSPTGTVGSTSDTGNATTGGGGETRPVNFAVNFFIKY